MLTVGASSSGYHTPMSLEMRDKLRKQRGTPVFVYDANDFTLLFIFESKQYMINTRKIHHKSLSACVDYGQLYLDTFFFSPAGRTKLKKVVTLTY